MWQLCFNPSKCFVMRLTHSRPPKYFDYMLGNQKLIETDGHPYLGVFISNKLTWNQHAKEITSKANRTPGFIRHNLHSCPKKQRKQAFMTLVRPYIILNSLPRSGTLILGFSKTKLKKYRIELLYLSSTTIHLAHQVVYQVCFNLSTGSLFTTDVLQED